VLVVLVNVTLAINVRLVLQVQPEVPVWMALQATLANQVIQAKITHRAKTVETMERPAQLHHLVKDHQDHPVQQVPPVRKALQVHPEAQAKVADKDHLVPQVPLAQLEEMANPVVKALMATTPQEAKARKDQRDHLDPSVLQDPKDQTEIQPPVAADPVNPVHPAHPVPAVQLRPQANKAHKDHLATPVQTPNTVPVHHAAAWSTAVALSLYFAISTKPIRSD